MNNDNLYWLFSAAAQSISAFVAFLLTGYALVHTLMESAREKDDTLEENTNYSSVVSGPPPGNSSRSSGDWSG